MNKTFRALALALAVALLLPVTALASWPVQSRYSYISQGYSSRHPALDIAGTRGTGVVPIGGGTVVFAGWKNNCGGYQVWIRHRDGVTYSAYYHLASETTYAGDYVLGEQERIGYLGSSGCVTGAHVHLEVWKGTPWRSGSYRVNPWWYVDDGYWLPYRYR